MTEPDREARKKEVDERLAGINERLDRLLAFQLPIGAPLEARVQNLERQVTPLRHLLTLMLLQTSSNKSEALDRLERALDQAESSDG
jgi:hypothetical protein